VDSDEGSDALVRNRFQSRVQESDRHFFHASEGQTRLERLTPKRKDEITRSEAHDCEGTVDHKRPSGKRQIRSSPVIRHR
jgi:hypothetical protein